MEREDFHKNANISGDLRSQPSCEDVGNLSEVDDGNNVKGIRNEDEFQDLTVVADQNEPIEASQRKAEAEQVSTGEGKDSLNPDCQQNPGVATERQDHSEQAPDQKNVTDTKGNARLTLLKSQKSAATTVAKGPRSSFQVQKPRLAQNKITPSKGVSKGASKNVMDANGRQKNNRSPDSQMSPASNGSLPLSANPVTASTGLQTIDVNAARLMSATTKKQQGNALLNRSKSQKSAATTVAKGPCSSSEVQKPTLPSKSITPLKEAPKFASKNGMDAIGKQMSPASNGTPLSANPVTAQSDCTVQQPVAPASTGFQTIDRRMSATSVKSFSTTKKQQGHRKILRKLSVRQHGQHGQQTTGPHAPFPFKVEATQNYALPPNAPRPNALGIPRPYIPSFGGFPPPYPSSSLLPSLPR